MNDATLTIYSPCNIGHLGLHSTTMRFFTFWSFVPINSNCGPSINRQPKVNFGPQAQSIELTHIRYSRRVWWTWLHGQHCHCTVLHCGATYVHRVQWMRASASSDWQQQCIERYPNLADTQIALYNTNVMRRKYNEAVLTLQLAHTCRTLISHFPSALSYHFGVELFGTSGMRPLCKFLGTLGPEEVPEPMAIVPHATDEWHRTATIHKCTNIATRVRTAMLAARFHTCRLQQDSPTWKRFCGNYCIEVRYLRGPNRLEAWGWRRNPIAVSDIGLWSKIFSFYGLNKFQRPLQDHLYAK